MTARPPKVTAIRRLLLDRIAAEPGNGWVCVGTLAREYRLSREAVQEHVAALTKEGRLQGHDLGEWTRTMRGGT